MYAFCIYLTTLFLKRHPISSTYVELHVKKVKIAHTKNNIRRKIECKKCTVICMQVHLV